MVKLNKALVLKVFGIRLPHWVIIALWLMGIIAMSGLTVKDLYPIVDDYYNENQNAQVQIKVRGPDEAFRAPDLFLCIALPQSSTIANFTSDLVDYLEREKECPQCEKMTLNSYDVWNRVSPVGDNETVGEMLTSANNISDAAVLLKRMFIERVLELDPDHHIILEAVPWNRPIIDAVVDDLREATNREMSILDQLRSPSNFTSARPNPIGSQLSLEQVDALYTIFATFMCDSIQLGSNPNRFDCMSFMRTSSLVLSDPSFLCTRVPLEDEEAVEILVSSRSLFYDITLESIDYLSAEKRFVLTTENPSYRSIIGSLPIAKLYETQDSDLGLDQVVTMTYLLQSSVDEQRPGKLKTCYHESSSAECELRCWIERLEAVCGCQSYVYRNRSLSSPMETRSISDTDIAYCIPKELQICGERIQNHTEIYDCSKKCSIPCHSFAYQWQVSSSISSVPRFVPLELNIQLRRQSYLEFIMKVKDTSEDLVSQVGGVFNFYMGLSGLSLIFIVIYLFESVLRYFELRRKGVVESNEQPGVSHLQQRWAQLTTTAALAARNQAPVDDSDLKKEMSAMNLRLEESERATDQTLDRLELKLGKRMDGIETSVCKVVESVASVSARIRDIRDALDAKKNKHIRKKHVVNDMGKEAK